MKLVIISKKNQGFCFEGQRGALDLEPEILTSRRKSKMKLVTIKVRKGKSKNCTKPNIDLSK